MPTWHKKLSILVRKSWRRFFGRYEILDERETARKNPYTYYMPSQARLDAIEVGDHVKIVIRSIPESHLHDAERLWVTVKNIDDNNVTGTLNNIPIDIPQLSLGASLHFKRWNIIDTDWADPEKEGSIPPEPSRQIWDRCLVDQAILDGTARVGFIYRETPDMGDEDDKYPDSGWRIRADVDDLTDAQYDEVTPAYIAIGKVLNQDDSWLHLVGSEIGSSFILNKSTGEFETAD